ncbi:DUF4202 domain-containing protein [Gramella jeungdoensis]|uniref:DUF4202 domain-containing protein n=1 Tax=Gramella jeungdoensis TaxID=708091 RepID=A0ABT0Z036_9FLAO|nr:DUF4202 domain-containing protein [Gramella jeungdoensis]MCM8569088.1 DUF4202 domain-containing protein [Gramella jeungdoensis]
MSTKFEEAIRRIDSRNSEDPNHEMYMGESFPKELLYSQRMSRHLEEFSPNAPEELRIAARAQHICRWKVDRSEYPSTRVGYLKWRNELKKLHASLTAEILEEVGYDEEFIERVKFLIQKKKIKKDEDSQTLEDVICLVFLQYYLHDFAAKHEDDKVVDIIKKTWAKMSEKGHKAALQLPLDAKSKNLVEQALA